MKSTPYRTLGTVLVVGLSAAGLAGPGALGAEPPPRAELAGAGPLGWPLAMHLVVTSSEAFLGGEFGLQFDRDQVRVLSVGKGPDFPSGSSVAGDPDLIIFDAAPPGSCPPAADSDGALIVAWRHPGNAPAPLGPGRCRVLEIVFEPAPGAGPDPRSRLRFVRCLGDPRAPVRCVLTDTAGRSVNLETEDNACPPRGFVRGDVERGMEHNITDAIRILEGVFQDASRLDCLDAADVDDDGFVEITDAVYLLRNLFSVGPPPPAPYQECGEDPTDDDGIGCDTKLDCP